MCYVYRFALLLCAWSTRAISDIVSTDSDHTNHTTSDSTHQMSAPMIDALLAFAESPLLLATAALTAVAIVTAWLMVRSSSPATPVRSNTFSTTPGPRGRVTRLVTYPVKSCAGIDLREATLGVGGFERDREWMVVRRVAPSDDASDAKSGGDGDVNNAVEWEKLTIREYPHLATLQPSFAADGEQLILTTPDDGASLVVEEPTGGASVECLMWRARVRGVDQGDAAAEFITAFLRRNERKVERAVRLIRMAGDDPQGLCRLDGDGKYAPVVEGLPADLQDGVTRFADWAPLSLVTTQSLDWLRGTLRKSSPSPAVAENLVARLRTNIIVDCALPTGGEMRGDGGEEAEGEGRRHGGCCGAGGGEGAEGERPFQEDTWTEFVVGEVECLFLKRCGRCAVPTIDPATGKRDARAEPLRTLKQERGGVYPFLGAWGMESGGWRVCVLG